MTDATPKSKITDEEQQAIETRLVHPVGDTDPCFGDVVVPIHLSSTFRQTDLGEVIRFDYSRGGNPTRQVLEDHIAALEGGTNGYAFASGMAAITAVLSLFNPGDIILTPKNIYGGTYRVLDRHFDRYGIKTISIDFAELEEVESALKKSAGSIKALLFESPSNPLLSIVDIAAVSKLAHDYGALSIIDNTFMTPYLQRPIELGCDIVIHSATKYLGGHSDIIAGLVVANTEALGEKIHFIQYSTGAVLSPTDSYYLDRGIKSLSARLDRHCDNADELAKWLKSHELVKEVYYPGLPEHPGHEIHAKQARRAGALISFELDPRIDIKTFGLSLKTIILAESLGAVESLMCHPPTMTHASVPASARKEMGISETMLRFSVGIENEKDLKQDIETSLQTALK
jgi:cystathionine beta-lyase